MKQINKMTKPSKLKSTFFVGSFLLSLIFSLSIFGQNKNAQTNYLITPNSVGDITIGMTVADARKVFKKAEFNQYGYGEEGTWIEVTKGEKTLIRFTTDQNDEDESDDEGKVKIDESAKIERIEISDSRYKTADGIHPESLISEAEKKFGKVKEIQFWGLDGSEHIYFANAPKTLSFTVRAKKGSDDEAMAGIYAGDEVSTTKYAKDAILSAITVSKMYDDNTSEEN